jgi:hypothetical protein
MMMEDRNEDEQEDITDKVAKRLNLETLRQCLILVSRVFAIREWVKCQPKIFSMVGKPIKILSQEIIFFSFSAIFLFLHILCNLGQVWTAKSPENWLNKKAMVPLESAPHELSNWMVMSVCFDNL